MVQEKGSISIHTENIFPIIKKFLYSDNEIFLRELISNAVDATQKIKRLASLGQYNNDLGELKVEVSLDEAAKTITVSDKGLGMTAEEIKKLTINWGITILILKIPMNKPICLLSTRSLIIAKGKLNPSILNPKFPN